MYVCVFTCVCLNASKPQQNLEPQISNKHTGLEGEVNLPLSPYAHPFPHLPPHLLALIRDPPVKSNCGSGPPLQETASRNALKAEHPSSVETRRTLRHRKLGRAFPSRLSVI